MTRIEARIQRNRVIARFLFVAALIALAADFAQQAGLIPHLEPAPLTRSIK
jgi:hypothetical protein